MIDEKFVGLAETTSSSDGVIRTTTASMFWSLLNLTVTVLLVPGNKVSEISLTDQVIFGCDGDFCQGVALTTTDSITMAIINVSAAIAHLVIT